MTVKIQGKEYMEVAERLSIFREKHPSGQIITEIVSLESGIVTMKASVIIDGVIIATGHAQEKEGSTFINKTSFIENCETSAVGRALGIFGIGLLDSVATANEVMNARANQKLDSKAALFPEVKPMSDDEFIALLAIQDSVLLAEKMDKAKTDGIIANPTQLKTLRAKYKELEEMKK